MEVTNWVLSTTMKYTGAILITALSVVSANQLFQPIVGDYSVLINSFINYGLDAIVAENAPVSEYEAMMSSTNFGNDNLGWH